MDSVNEGIPGIYKANQNSNALEGSVSKPDSVKNVESLPMNRRKKPKSNCSKNLLYYFQSFSDNASIDGLKFLGESGRNIFERIFWAIILTSSLVLCILLVIQTFKKWINSPVIVSFATTETRVHEIPFPAITICPEVKADKLLFNYTEIYLKINNNQTVTSEELENFKSLSLVCELIEDEDVLSDTSKFTNKSALEYLTWVDPELNTFEILWKGEEFDDGDIEELFTPILTSEGVCYTFNILDRSEIFREIVDHHQDCFTTKGKYTEWSLENGYAKNSTLNSYPRRTPLAGANGGLRIIFYIDDNNLDYACGDSLQGFKVTLHHPAEVPRVKENYFRIPLDQSVVAAVKPDMMTTSEELKSYSPKDRKCYFVHEKNLKFFKIYNQQNCLLECLTNFTLNHCGCVGFYMPREESTPICGAWSKYCIKNAEVMFLISEVKYNLKSDQEKFNFTHQEMIKSCDCLPSCFSLQFNVEVSQSNWNWLKQFEVQRSTPDWDTDLETLAFGERPHFSRLEIFFKNMQFITSERNELYGYTDFWANIGGVIGLFTGFSFITLFEVFYYLTLRLWCNVQMYGKRYWSGSEQLIVKDQESVLIKPNK